MEIPASINKHYLDILNQIFDIEQKLGKLSESNSIHRNLNKLKAIFEFEILEGRGGLIIHNPQGEPYDETRTDCEASISGDASENLMIQEVIKPIIRWKGSDTSLIVQRGVVVVGQK